MASRRYPLERLAALRDERVREASLRVAEGTRVAEQALDALRDAEEACARVLARAEEVRSAEFDALQRGERTAADLARLLAWEKRAEAEKIAAEGRVDRARAATEAAERSLSEARAKFALAEVEAKVVENDRGLWHKREDRAEEARAEEERSEAWRPKASG